jgi:hypothetical protein
LTSLEKLLNLKKKNKIGYSDFHLYVSASFLLRFSKELLKQKDFQVVFYYFHFRLYIFKVTYVTFILFNLFKDLMLFLQNLPTRTWNSNVTILTAEAYKLQFMFANAPKHIKSTNTNNKNKGNE